MRKIITLIQIVLLISCKSVPNNTQTEVEVNTEAEIKIEAEGETAMTDQELSVFTHKSGAELPVTSFKEIWGYVLAGQETAFKRNMPLTDIAYFGAEVDIYGALSKVPARKNLPPFHGRVHLTVTCGNYALTYFALLPGSPQRKSLIADLIKAANDYDGLNIDFENIPEKSADDFLSFLRELRSGLGNKMLTIALYARTRTLTNDVYDYAKITPLVDRVFVMAYDQHWGGGTPGPVSSIRWCRSVAEYSLRVIGKEKLVMGIPFYGRAWVSQNHHRALIFSTIERLINTNKADVKRENGTPTFDYNAEVSVKVYFEDEYSISARFVMYKSMGINSVGFWRIGQETPKVWQTIRIE